MPVAFRSHRRPDRRRTTTRRALGAALALTGLATACTITTPGAAVPGQAGGNKFTITVLSGQPDQVSGGDALVSIDLPDGVAAAQARITLDGADISTAFADQGDGTVQGLVTGLDDGDNVLAVEATGGGRRPRPAQLTLVNHPIGGPIF
jgi:Tannase-like family of unknown function (DUF6351)